VESVRILLPDHEPDWVQRVKQQNGINKIVKED
jgi:hypothetical protein